MDQDNVKKTQVQLTNFNENSFVVPYEFNCDTCFLLTSFQSDTLNIEILSPGNCTESIGRIKAFSDTLLIYSHTKPDKVDTIIKFNEQANKIDTTICITISSKEGHSHCMSILTYTVIGLKKEPAFIRYNDHELQKCKDRESFLIPNNDAINYTDKFGLKQGLWIEYYKSGRIKSKDYYENSIIQHGCEYDEKGDTISIRIQPIF